MRVDFLWTAVALSIIILRGISVSAFVVVSVSSPIIAGGGGGRAPYSFSRSHQHLRGRPGPQLDSDDDHHDCQSSRKDFLQLMNGLLLNTGIAGNGIFIEAQSAAAGPTKTAAVSNTSTTTNNAADTENAWHHFDYHTADRLPWLPGGYSTWEWRGHRINYIELGGDDDDDDDDDHSSSKHKPALLFLHGWGASAYHFRSNLPVLARDGFRVYALDLLGFGLSDKPVLSVEYSAALWRNQTADFLRQIIRRPTVIAGNSLGGLIALYTCTAGDIQALVRGCVLLNVAGGFRRRSSSATRTSSSSPADDDPNSWVLLERIGTALERLVFLASFQYVKSPARIAQVLRDVYPVHPERIDDELVEALYYPSLDENAAEVYYRVSAAAMSRRQGLYIDDLLERLQCPLLLCWGVRDPWYGPDVADRIQALYPADRCQRTDVVAGHCPHDEAPRETNHAIRAFVQEMSIAS